VTGYLGFFPIDIFVFSRMYSANSRIRFCTQRCSPQSIFFFYHTGSGFTARRTTATQCSLRCFRLPQSLASAFLTVDTTFLILFFVYMLFAVAVFATLELRRGVSDAVPAELPNPQERERRMARRTERHRRDGDFRRDLYGRDAVLFFPRFSAGYMGHSNMNTTLMSGFPMKWSSAKSEKSRKHRRRAARQTGAPVEYDRLRWRGIALATFDGTKWSSGGKGSTAVLRTATVGSQ